MMAVIGILGIILAIAVPSFKAYFTNYRAKRAAETMNAFIVNGRSESAKRNVTVRAVYTWSNAGATWCAGLTTNSAGCTCTTANSCVLDSVERVISSADFRDVLLVAPATGTALAFDPQRGSTTASTVTLESSGGRQISIVLSGQGRIKMCSPAGAYMGGYAEC